MEKIKEKIFNINSEKEFNDMSIHVFRFQYRENKVYKEFVDLLNIDVENIVNYTDIPFLPIEFFKTHEIVSFERRNEKYFVSSGTTNSVRSKHYIYDENLYKESFNRCFELFYGQPQEYCFLALMPEVDQSPHSSLAYMLDNLIKKSKFDESGFYLEKGPEILKAISKVRSCDVSAKIMLFGLTYSLLDISAELDFCNKDLFIVETGGMKGMRKEITRPELYERLRKSFNVKHIHSEYSMTELFSQSYSKSDGVFFSPPWMKILIRDLNDFRMFYGHGKTGGVNIIDLANIYSCSFIATQDLGKTSGTGSFEILGRFDHSDLRGCNLLQQ
jgi:hypothetical protein